MKANPIRIILPLLTATLLVSCSKGSGEGPGSEPAQAIVFGTAEISKGTPVSGTTLPDGAQFGLFTYRLPAGGGGALPGTVSAGAVAGYMPDNTRLVKQSDNSCTYNPVSYWPQANNDRLKFFAYYPYIASNGSSGVTYSTAPSGNDAYLNLAYTVNDVPMYQVDLMYAVTDELYHAPVPIRFNHALTRVTFSAQLDVASTDGKTIKISAIRLTGVVKKGTLAVRSVPAVWTLSNAPADAGNFELSVSNGRLKDVSLPNAAGGAAVYVPLLEDLNNLLLLPQSPTGVGLEVDISVSEGMSETVETNYFSLASLPSTPAWGMADQVNYRITLTRTGANLTGTISPWTDSGSGGGLVE